MTIRDGAFAIYLRSLISSWEGLAASRADASVVHGMGYVAARFPEPYLNNAVILTPDAVELAAESYQAGEAYALWCLDDDQPTAAALADHGFAHSEITRPMLRSLDYLPEPGGVTALDADLERFADLVGLPDHLLRGVPAMRVYADGAYDSGLMVQRIEDDAYVSMVFTRPEARGRGLATALLTAALRDARDRGARTATLQSTSMAERLYTRHGFQPVGRWQEWVR